MKKVLVAMIILLSFVMVLSVSAQVTKVDQVLGKQTWRNAAADSTLYATTASTNGWAIVRGGPGSKGPNQAYGLMPDSIYVIGVTRSDSCAVAIQFGAYLQGDSFATWTAVDTINTYGAFATKVSNALFTGADFIGVRGVALAAGNKLATGTGITGCVIKMRAFYTGLAQ